MLSDTRDRKTRARPLGIRIDKEDFVRSTVVIAFALAASACSVLEQIDFGGSRLDRNKVYLNATDVVVASPRETHRYACVDRPLLCVQHGIGFECRCP
jgi:hypothetical protein